MSDPRTIEQLTHIHGALAAIDARVAVVEKRLGSFGTAQEQLLSSVDRLNSNLERLLGHYRDLNVKVSEMESDGETTKTSISSELRRVSEELTRVKSSLQSPGRYLHVAPRDKNNAPPRR